MKITKPDADSLILENSTMLFKIVGVVFLVVGVVLLYFMTESYTLKCSSPKKQCVLVHKQWYSTTQRTIEKIDKAKVTYSRRNENGINYYLKLKTGKRVITLNQISSPSKAILKSNAKKINQYLKNPKNTLYIKQLYPYWLFILPVVLIIISDLLFILPKKVVARFSRSEKKLVINRKNVFSKENKEYNLDDIKEVTLEETAGKNGRMYRLAFVFKNGISEPLTKTYDNLLPNKLKAMKTVSEFLHLPINPQYNNLDQKQSKIALVIFLIAVLFIGMSFLVINR